MNFQSEYEKNARRTVNNPTANFSDAKSASKLLRASFVSFLQGRNNLNQSVLRFIGDEIRRPARST